MTNPYQLASEAADELRVRSGVDAYDLAIVLGSGWKEGALALGTPFAEVATGTLRGFVAPTVVGHAGQILSIDVAVRLMWSLMTTTEPGPLVGSMPPQALVRMTFVAPAAMTVRTGWATWSAVLPS